MDTKWKNIRKKISTLLGFVLCFLSGLFLLWGICFSDYLQYADKTAPSYTLKEFVFSHPTVQKAASSCTNILFQMNFDTGFSRNKIEQGDFPRWNNRKEELHYPEEEPAESNPYPSEGSTSSNNTSSSGSGLETPENNETVQVERELYIQAGLSQYDLYLEQLEKACGDSFVISFVGNGSEDIPFDTPFDMEKYLFRTTADFSMSYEKSIVNIYIGVDRAYAQQLYSRFGRSQWIGVSSFAGLLLAALSGLAGVVLLVLSGCRRTEAGGVRLHWWDYVFPDLSLGLAAAVFAVGLGILPSVYQSFQTGELSPFLYPPLEAILLFAFWVCLAWAITSGIKWAQKHQFWRHLLVLQPLRFLFFLLRNAARKLFLSQPKSWRLLLLWLLSLFGTGLVTFGMALLFAAVSYSDYNRSSQGAWMWFGGILGFLLCCLVVLGILSRYNNAFKKLSDGIQKIQAGALDEKIPPTGVRPLDQTAENVNHLADGLRAAVEEEVASQRMKAELITNVSHDLKTPLTSIISYVDLLSKEEMISDTAKSYLAILQEKSERLRMLVENLFEISKAESGNIKVNLTRLCLQDLLQQILAEYEERFQSMGLQPRFHYPAEKTFVLGDSMILWRVFSNLLGNIAKYAMPNTRVYIDISVDAQSAFVTLKNLANYEMDFDENEILQRFARGDTSRTGEGSGLGLAIADSFLAASNGSFRVVVDGDLFKAIVQLPLAGDTPEETNG